MNLDSIILKINGDKFLSKEENNYCFELLETIDKKILSLEKDSPNYESQLRDFESQKDIIKKILVKGNEGIILRELWKYEQDSEYDDLRQEANLALILAIEKFNYMKNPSFYAYAKKCIQYSIIEYMNKNKRLISVPRNFFKNHPDERDRENILSQTDVLSLNYDYEEGEELSSHLSNETNMEIEIINNYVHKVLYESLQSLSPIERDILSARFGLITGEPRTLKEIAELYGSTTNKIYQIEKKAIEKLRNLKSIKNLK